MLAAGGGAIVCVSARAALQPFPGAAGYITAKAAVLAFVDALDAEYRDDGIRANAILPSVIDTPANRASMPDADFDTLGHAREQIARVIRFLVLRRRVGHERRAHAGIRTGVMPARHLRTTATGGRSAPSASRRSCCCSTSRS